LIPQSGLKEGDPKMSVIIRIFYTVFLIVYLCGCGSSGKFRLFEKDNAFTVALI
jgi:hypothetical protein